MARPTWITAFYSWLAVLTGCAPIRFLARLEVTIPLSNGRPSRLGVIWALVMGFGGLVGQGENLGVVGLGPVAGFGPAAG